MKTDKIYNLIILDESGSMQSIKKATIDGFNELVQNIKGIEKQFPEQEHFITFVTFNGLGIKTHLNKQPVAGLSQIDENSFNPNSLTPLYDAIGLSTLSLFNEIKNQSNTSVLVTILTDGMENDSKEFDHKKVKKIIEDLKKHDWTFTYIGANHEVEKTAISLSITNSMQFMATEADVKEMFIKENNARVRYSERTRAGESRHDMYYEKD